MAIIPDLTAHGGTFLLTQVNGETRVLLRPIEDRAELAAHLDGTGFKWSTPHDGFVADRSWSYRQLKAILPRLTPMETRAVPRVVPAEPTPPPASAGDAHAWVMAQSDQIAARDIVTGDHEKLWSDVEHSYRGLTRDGVISMIRSAEAAAVIPGWHGDRLFRGITGSPALPAWYTVLPTEGLATNGEDASVAYKSAPGRLAEDALNAVTKVQWQGDLALFGWVLPGTPTHLGIARLVPQDQAMSEPWRLMRQEPFRLGWLPRERALAQLTKLLFEQPILSTAAVEAPAAPTM